jgi:F-type H+-transporting ATPase subunit delta
VADAEGALERVEDELFRFGRAVQEHPELRDRLVDPSIDTGTKLGIVTDLLGDRAHPQTLSAIAFVVQAGRARQLTQIADAVARIAAESRAQAVAEVRTAVELTDDHRALVPRQRGVCVLERAELGEFRDHGARRVVGLSHHCMHRSVLIR